MSISRLDNSLCCTNTSMALSEAPWGDTHLVLPDAGEDANYRNVFTDEIVGAEPRQEGTQALIPAVIFASFPAALLAKVV